jgi:BirA family transcriptional regulator, biotin operon repressor / biotin---[acetyl-CoA-carboxylase] ligase
VSRATDARAAHGSARYDGLTSGELARRLALPTVAAYESIGSTLDAAHVLAEQGAAPGTLVIADAQTSGRGRLGRAWRSEPGAGIWLTLIERPADVTSLEVLSLRVGLALAPALEPFSRGAVSLKWPNDLYVGRKKLAGILTEARWRDGRPEWVAIGVGINLRAPEGEQRATGLDVGVTRMSVLEAVVPGVRAAAAATGPLGDAERAAFAARDLASGWPCLEPREGTVRGIDASGALLIEVASGIVSVRAGSLVLAEER